MEETPEAPTTVDGAALRDAAEILALVEADEHAALVARRDLRERGLPDLPAEPGIAVLLEPGETVVEVRASVVVERQVRGAPVETTSGRLYVTSCRLLLAGRGTTIAAWLVDIEELSLAAERLLVTLRDGTGLSFDAGRPRLLRVQIAAALEAARATTAALREPDPLP
ncbi:MAG TPA: hypothetical protein VFI28_09085 [Candidatus Limnocylindrales bacterium]|nr:hypothetical protein [Candidatus Limnocylindrales bacterium]